MEIRNALQKIENYLTVVSNLNKTILSEGTMSRDELLLMKKYLYTSIDRIEDIERLLIIDRKEEKSFVPSKTEEQPVYTPSKEKEIIEVADAPNLEEIEAAIGQTAEAESSVAVSEIVAELIPETPIEMPAIALDEYQEESLQPVSDIITEDFVVDQLEAPAMGLETPVANIITEDFVVDKTEETIADVNPLVASEYTPENIVFPAMHMEETPKAELVAPVENIITEDFVVDKVEESILDVNPLVASEYTPENIVFPAMNTRETPKVELVVPVENIITEDFVVDKAEETIVSVNPLVAAEYDAPVVEFPPAEKSADKIGMLTDTFQEKTSTWADEFIQKKTEDKPLFELLEDKMNTTKQSQLFQLFDEEKEQESFSGNTTLHIPAAIDMVSTGHTYGNESVLVAEKETETLVEQMTPSSLNEVFKPLESLQPKINKTLSESIALNDKFIFVRELFGNKFAEYESALRQIDALQSFDAAENYCKTALWNKFNWSERTSAVERFMGLLQSRY